MRQTLIALGLMFVGYVLGTQQSPARADDNDKIVALLRDLVRAEEKQVDALRTIAGTRCSR
jgi:hypothetical protein